MDSKRKFDVAVLGGGPGGYVAAIKAAQTGCTVALIEAKELGGTCLNRGCIPTKTLVASSEVLHKVKEASHFGISVSSIAFDYSKINERTNSTVSKIRKGLEGLIASNQITVIRGFGKFISPTEIKVIGQDNVIIEAEKIIIATGSEPRNMPAFPFDGERIHSSTSILALTSLPKKIAIIGGGVIGCEFASLYAEFGVEIEILELLPSILPMEGKEVAQALNTAFIKRGIKIQTGVMVEGIEHTKTGVSVKLKDLPPVEADIALVSVGRQLNTEGIGLESTGIATERGVIPVNDRMETAVRGIYAIGDITAKWLLAHVASHQGIVAANNATGHPCEMHYNAVPSVIFTRPEIATVGMSLEKAQAAGYDASIGKFPFQALGKSQATLDTDGFAQVIIDRKTGQILGAQVVGHEATSLIAEMTVAIQNELTVESIADTIHAHPTLPEAWMEAVLLANNTPIHFPPKAKKKAPAPS